MVEQLKQRKKQLENEILTLVNKFEEETKVYVQDIDLISNCWQTTNGREVRTTEVIVNIKI